MYLSLFCQGVDVVKSQPVLTLIRNFAIELLLYGFLVVLYFVVVLRWMGQPLLQVFQENPPIYAAAALILIVVQGVALEVVTSFLVERLGLERLE
jgi:hypothetical protein